VFGAPCRWQAQRTALFGTCIEGMDGPDDVMSRSGPSVRR
jgi:hypothetical protein